MPAPCDYLAGLRTRVEECISKQQYDNASFFADKIVSMSQGDPDDVALLARTFFLSRQYRRAFHLMKERNLTDPSAHIKFRYLAAKCKAEAGEWNECLPLIGGDVDDGNEEDSMIMDDSENDSSMRSAVCLLRGQACEALSNGRRAAHWYKETLKIDATCYEAFDRLIEAHHLERNEEEELMSNLRFAESDTWLKVLYTSRLRKSDHLLAPVETNFENILGQYGLGDNPDVGACLADLHYHRHDFKRAYQESNHVLEKDPFHQGVLQVHISSLVEIGRKSDLYKLAHDLVEEYPEKAVSWYAVGCYYYLTKKFEKARRYFSKATSLDKRFVYAWLGYGHAFAAQDESDQAMAAYRTATRLLVGCHLPPLFIGMEYLRTSNMPLAELLFDQACNICPSDPLVYNELGVICYKSKEYRKAARYFLQVLEYVSPSTPPETWEPTMFNLGHAFRKLKEYEKAIEYYNMALSASPKNASVYSSQGFTYHLMGDLDNAIKYYHKALGLKSDDTITSDLLEKALEEIATLPL